MTDALAAAIDSPRYDAEALLRLAVDGDARLAARGEADALRLACHPVEGRPDYQVPGSSLAELRSLAEAAGPVLGGRLVARLGAAR